MSEANITPPRAPITPPREGGDLSDGSTRVAPVENRISVTALELLAEQINLPELRLTPRPDFVMAFAVADLADAFRSRGEGYDERAMVRGVTRFLESALELADEPLRTELRIAVAHRLDLVVPPAGAAS